MSLRALLRSFITWVIQECYRREFNSQVYLTFNERPVEYRFVFDQLSTYWPKNILDVGSGESALPRLMRTSGFLVTATDNFGSYWFYRLHNWHYYLVPDDIIATNLPVETFDLVTCVSSLEHIPDFNAAVKGMVSTLKNGGHLILTFPYNEHQYHPNVYKIEGSNAPKGTHYITQAFSRQEIDIWEKMCGLQVIKQEYWQFFSGNYWSVGTRLAMPICVDRLQKHQISCVVFQKSGLS